MPVSRWVSERKRRGRWGLTDEVVDVEGLVVDPAGVADVWVPSEMGADDVICGGAEKDGGGD